MQAWYLYHDSGDLAAIVYGANSPYNATAQEKIVYIHSDHLGTPRIAFDSTKRVVWRWESDAFGTTAPLQDPDNDGIATVINLRFPSQYYDAESKLHYNWNRYYDPSLGRYISSDPIGLSGGLNTFGYVFADPLNWIDPEGLEAAELESTLPIAQNFIRIPAPPPVLACAAAGAGGYLFGSWLYDNILQEPLANVIDSITGLDKQFSEDGSYTGHGENPEGKTGSGAKWNKHSGRRAGTSYGGNRNENRGDKNKKYQKPKNPNKRK